MESARLGFHTIADEYNPVACSVLEATVQYPIQFDLSFVNKTKKWGAELRKRFNKHLQHLYPKKGIIEPHCYIFARTVPCPDTQFDTPLVPDWHLLKPKETTKVRIVAEPLVDKAQGTWSVRIRELGRGAGKLPEAPKPTYSKGKGISLFTGRQIPADYIKAKAQAGEMRSALYAVAVKTADGLEFQPPEDIDVLALREAERELQKRQPGWLKNNILPTEEYPQISSDERPRLYGMPRWIDMFSPRQLLCMGTLVEELRALRPEIIQAEGEEIGEAIVHLLALVINKFLNYNCILGSWHAPRMVMRSLFDRHDYSFKVTFAEMAPCGSGVGLAWAIDNVLEAYENLAKLPRAEKAKPVEIHLGSSTNLPQIEGKSITAVVVDPPYADNVQYSELADFFYVWLKRTIGYRRPEWYSTQLCEHDQEAVVNISRHRDKAIPSVQQKKRDGKTAEARKKAHAFYQKLMTETFRECHRILRDDGVLTVMFTHKKQEAWETLFTSLIQSGFRITATWPVKTESEHSLHQAKKNAA